MQARELLNLLTVAERLKDTTRHCYTSKGRRESVAEHSWIRMCIIHDLGEAFTGDIPAFEKTAEDEKKEEELLYDWVRSIPKSYAEEMQQLYKEMEERKTLEAKIYKAIDGLEAVIQHNFSDLSTWIPKEYEMNQTYANDRVTFSDYLTVLREEIRKDTIEKIER